MVGYSSLDSLSLWVNAILSYDYFNEIWIIFLFYEIFVDILPQKNKGRPEANLVEVERVVDIESRFDWESCYVRIVALIQLKELEQGVAEHNNRNCNAATRAKTCFYALISLEVEGRHRVRELVQLHHFTEKSI